MSEEEIYFKKIDKYETMEVKDLPPLQKDKMLTVLDRNTLTRSQENLHELDDTRLDESYKELLQWDLELPRKKFTPVDLKPEVKENGRSELVEMLLQRKGNMKKPEFELTPPGDIVRENDKIIYPRHIVGSISGRRLQFSENYLVLKQTKSKGKKQDGESEGAVQIKAAIGKMRNKISAFKRDWDEFTYKTKFISRTFDSDKRFEKPAHNQLRIVKEGIKNRKNSWKIDAFEEDDNESVEEKWENEEKEMPVTKKLKSWIDEILQKNRDLDEITMKNHDQLNNRREEKRKSMKLILDQQRIVFKEIRLINKK